MKTNVKLFVSTGSQVLGVELDGKVYKTFSANPVVLASGVGLALTLENVDLETEVVNQLPSTEQPETSGE